MRILHTEASTGWGGQDMRVLREAQLMRARGHEVWIACAADCPLARGAREYGIPVEPLEFGRKLKWSAVFTLRRFIRRKRIEIVNTHSSADGWSGAVAARMARRGGLPLVVRTRHIANPIKNNRANTLLYHRLNDYVITTGSALRDTLIRDNDIPENRIASIPTGVDTAEFQPEKWPREAFRQEIEVPSDRFLWGMVAMIRRVKGHDVLAQAVAQLVQTHPQAHFAIVGDIPSSSPVRENFETLLRELKIESHFTLTGFRDDIANVWAGCDAAVLPSLSEGVPQSLTQALAMAKPAVASNVGAIPEIVHHEKTGLLVPPGDPAALAAAMRRIMDDPSLAQTLGRNGQDLIRHEYSLEAMTDRVENLFSSLLTERSKDAP